MFLVFLHEPPFLFLGLTALLAFVSLLFCAISYCFHKSFLKSFLIKLSSCVLAVLILSFAVLMIMAKTNKISTPIIHRLLNTPVLMQYKAPNKEIEELENKIYNEYGIKIYTNIRPETIYNRDTFTTRAEAKEEDICLYLKRIYESLGMYKDEAISVLPKEFYLISDIDMPNEDVTGFNAHYYICFDTGYASEHPDDINTVIHHEFFHTLDKKMKENDLQYFVQNKEGCQLLSSHACDNIPTELVAEAWSHSLTNLTNSYFTDYMKKLYPDFLVLDFEGYEPVETVTAHQNYFYAQLSETEKEFYNALERLVTGKGNKYVIDGDRFDQNKVFDVLETVYPYIDNDRNCFIYSNDGKTYISLSEDYYKEKTQKLLDAKNEFKNSLNSIRITDDDYETILNIYKYCLNQTADYSGTARSRNNLLAQLLQAAGYETYYIEDRIIDRVLLNYQDHYYWLNAAVGFQEGAPEGLFAYFMVDDAKAITVGEFSDLKYKLPECNDSSMSYFSKNELYLEEFDVGKIENYIKGKVRNGYKNVVLYIDCVDSDVLKQTVDYLFAENSAGTTEVQIICDRYYRPAEYLYYYPGYSALIYEEVVVVTMLE